MELHPFLERDTRPSPGWWYVLSANGEHPSLRVGHSASFISALHPNEHDKVFIIGGANPSQVFSEVFVLDLHTRSWDTVEATGFRARYEHAAFQTSNYPSIIFIFGGATQTGNLNDVQKFDTSSLTWSDIEVNGTPPSPRTHRSCGIVKDKAYFYSGGLSGSDPVVDRKVHALDTLSFTWSELTPRGDPPKPRHGHVLVAHENSIYLHGGIAGQTFYDDLHVLDLERNTWTCVKKNKKCCSPRAAHDALCTGHEIIFYGGMNKTGALNDVYKYNIATNTWSILEPEGPPPANRLDFALCCVRLRVPKTDTTQGEAGQEELTGTSHKVREVLERELKPGSASSRDSVSDHSDEALFSLETTNTNQQPVNISAGGDDISPDDLDEVRMVLMNGGMDTEGEIFDDTLLMVL